MSDTLNRYTALAADFAARLEGTSPEQWSSPSPCTEWTARDVAAHVIGIQRRIVASATDAPPAGEPEEGEDLAGAFKEAAGAVQVALADPALAAKEVAGPFGKMPFEQIVGRIICTDILVHTWDLSRATGQDEALDPMVVKGAFSGLKPLDAVIRRPGLFGPAVESSPDADEQTQFLNFLGRTV